ncbi:polysaccharide biosynthesis/export family protein [Mesorhizobium sp. BH1-1-4]|uniref:polysaccharide biosynthesis/export family protein n=1 Tax=Mesorhizobium sp. BH1-1-4 TaxID=2876662 RepID=UPI001CD0F7BC|nr:polysaccharide biosynthesis/export family protein [Mesorhizobium sp. BH1-1-4]MBZ9993074.1 SLBB domain-containing protein [Mesorhizobium sp. BH1-1-4]
MSVSRQVSRGATGWMLLMCLAALITCGFPALAQAAGANLVPQTKLRVTVVQWVPVKGEFEQWSALGGDFVVSETGTLVLPVIGAVSLGEMDSTALAGEIAKRLQTQMGLVKRPDTTVEIIDYPPVYVVGAVTTPGEYKYRVGMTVLQALALSGGEARSNASDASKLEIQLVGDAQVFDAQILLSKARIARLQAEMSGESEIRFPTPVAGGLDTAAANEIFGQESIIFSARADELDRQTKSLTELCALLDSEIGSLNEKIKMSDASIKSAEIDLANVTMLVEKGIAIASRKSELERVVSSYKADRLDQVTAVMRAQQAKAAATRERNGLRDKFHTETAIELQTEQANLMQLAVKDQVAQQLLVNTLASASKNRSNGTDQPLNFTILRKVNGEVSEIPAVDSTTLVPGDVIKVAFPASPVSETVGAMTLPPASGKTAMTVEAGQ